MYFHEQEVMDLVMGKYPIWIQGVAGLGFGTIAALLATQIINAKFFASVKEFFADIFGGLHLNILDIAYLSICAGIGEELFFRGALQPWLGIWLTALIFIAVHGYLNPRNWRMSVYGVAMVVVSAGLGYLYQFLGMFSAMVAHASFDFVLLYIFIRNESTGIQDSKTSTED